MNKQRFTIQVAIADDGYTQKSLAELLRVLADAIDEQVGELSDREVGPVRAGFGTADYLVIVKHNTLTQFTAEAQQLWDAIPEAVQDKILHKVLCTRCRQAVTMINFCGRAEQGDLILRGSCFTCGQTVVRFVETGA